MNTSMRNTTRHYQTPLQPVRLALALAMALSALHQNALANPGVTIDPSAAQQAGLSSSTNGTPIVNIVAPDGNGLSHNVFTDFNVGEPGLILNNSNTSSRTALAGIIAGNNQLGDKSASIILNEVTGNAVSDLQGILEVAGQRAQVIIANPNGVTANGAGFVNANRVSLVAGNAVFDQNNTLTAFKTGQGQIRIEGAGLDASKTGQVDLIARTLQVNAALQAQALNISAVEGSVAVSQAGQFSVQGGSSDSQPVVAIDVGQLGSIHANSIYMVGSSNGVGVNIEGQVEAVTGDLSISSTGKVLIASSGELNARNRLSVTGFVENSGTIKSAGDVSLVGGMDNSRVIHGDGNVTLMGADLRNRASGSITSAKRLTAMGPLQNEGIVTQNNKESQGTRGRAAIESGKHVAVSSGASSKPVVAVQSGRTTPVASATSVVKTPAFVQNISSAMPAPQSNVRRALAQSSLESQMAEAQKQTEQVLWSMPKMTFRTTQPQMPANASSRQMESGIAASMQKMNDRMASSFNSFQLRNR